MLFRQNKFYYLSDNHLFSFLNALCEAYNVYVPVKKNNHRFYKKYTTPSEDILIGEVRPFEPLKIFFFRAREVVAEGFTNNIPHCSDKPFAILGVKACDLKGFKVLDRIFKNSDYKDPFYSKLRNENLIISADCTCAIDTCFCLALGIRPFPQEDFDINLSQVNDGFIVEVGSEKGQEIVKKYFSLCEDVQAKRLYEKDEQRIRVTNEVEYNIKVSAVPYQSLFKDIIEKNYESDIWMDEAKTCVECGACTNICPTCHCFLLYDQMDKDKMVRLRVWDSCMIKDYAQTAGGANPRAKLYMRLRNRFEKKFSFFPKVANLYACTGCGRCISACPAKIDIRKILNQLVHNVSNGKSIQAY
jgi:ferredoxin